MTYYKNFFLGLIFFFFIFFSSIYIFFNTNQGLNAMYLLIHFFITELKIDKITGKFGDYELNNFSYHISGVLIKSDSIHFIFEPYGILTGLFYIKKIQFNTITIQLDSERFKCIDVHELINYNKLLSFFFRKFVFF